MTIEQSVAQHSGVAVAIFSLLGGACVYLFIYWITQPGKALSAKVTTAIETLTAALNETRAELKEWRKEAKEDRTKDLHTMGTLLDRMQKQETICQTIRKFCPLGQDYDRSE